MKVIEKIFEQRMRHGVMQFGYMKDKRTTNATFMAREMQDNFRVKVRCCFVFLWIWRKLLTGYQEK